MTTNKAEVNAWIYLVLNEYSKTWQPYIANVKLEVPEFYLVSEQKLTYEMPPKEALTACTVAGLRAKIREIRLEAETKVAEAEELIQSLLALPAPTEGE